MVEDYRIEAIVEGQVATTAVTQVLRNDSDFLARGEFLHPIPSGAAVTGLTLWIDGEPVEGEVLEAEEARREYEKIVADVLDPALLEFVDDGLIRLEVFPIEGGGTRTVELEYSQVLPSEGGLTRFRHPFAREHAAVEVEHLSARIEIHTSGELKAVYSPTHSVGVDRIDPHTAVIGYEADNSKPESDLAVYYSSDEGPLGMSLLTHRDGEEGTFLLLVSPGLADPETITAKDVVIVLDVSGSMEGEKIAQARDAASRVLGSLNSDDRFDIIAFSTGTTSFGDGLRPVEEAGSGVRWAQALTAGGSTDIHGALTEAFERADEERPLFVMFLTDGLPTEGIVDTAEILESLDDAPAASLFAFGVGWDVDTILLDSLASRHHGTTTYVTPGEPIDDAVAALYAKVGSPVLTEVEIDIEGVEVTDLHPHDLPDIFSGEQLLLVGRYQEPGSATITLTGALAGEPYRLALEGAAFADDGGTATIPRVWAGKRIGDLLRRVRLDGPDPETIEQIVRLSIRYGIVTPYTSFLVTEDAPFGEAAADDIARSAFEAAAATPAPSSGQAAVRAADAARHLADSDVAGAPAGRYAETVRIAAGRAFRLSEGTWIDTTYDPDRHPVVRIPFASTEYFALVAAGSDVAERLAVGPSVLVISNGVAYQVVEPEAAAGPRPEIEVPPPPPSVTTEALPATIVDGPGLPISSMVAGALGVLGLLGLGALVRRDR